MVHLHHKKKPAKIKKKKNQHNGFWSTGTYLICLTIINDLPLHESIAVHHCIMHYLYDQMILPSMNKLNSSPFIIRN